MYTNHSAQSVSALGYRQKEDAEIYDALRLTNSILITKDSDFKHLSMRFGPPPYILLLAIGNTTNQHVREISAKHMPDIESLKAEGSGFIVIRDVG